MKKYLLLFLVVLLASVDVCAQQYNVYVKYNDGKPAPDVEIYSFHTKKFAEEAVKGYSMLNPVVDVRDRNKRLTGEPAKTGLDGTCILVTNRSAYLVIDDYEHLEKPLVLAVVDCLDENRDIRITITPNVKQEGDKKLDEVHRVEQVETKAQPKPTPPAPPIPSSYGKRKKIPAELHIDSELARDDARFVAFPCVVFPELDSVLYLKPIVVDGRSYRKSMERRMGFNHDNDKLNPYHLDNSFYMQSHLEEYFIDEQWVEVDKGVKFYADAQIWYEDYNGIYNRYVQKLHDGKEAEEMRFLDWEVAKHAVNIDTVLYKERGMVEKTDDNRVFNNLKFKVNETALNMADSATVKERSELLKMFEDFYANEEIEVLNVYIQGFSSPEGGFAKNKELSRGRTNHLVGLLKKEFPRIPEITPVFDENSNVVSWSSVASIMEKSSDPVVLRYASVVRDVVSQKQGFDAQNAALSKDRQMWTFIKDSVLPSVRRVEVKVEYLVSKVLTQNEIVERYQNKTLFTPEKKAMPYQYYELMRWLADNEKWDELQMISKMAYEDPAMIKYGREKRVLRLKEFNDNDGYKVAPLVMDSVNSYLKSRQGYAYLEVSTIDESTDKFAPCDTGAVKMEYRLNGTKVNAKSVHKPGTYNFEIYVNGTVPLFSQRIELLSSKPNHMVLCLDKEDASYPYPLAAYYYATCLLQKGEVDTKIMQRYLDDGKVERKVVSNGKTEMLFNDKAMIATQILMHCQNGDFESANKYVVKYGLSDDDPKLKPLIMFVKCLAGRFREKDVQDYVRKTSPMNEAVILVALQQWKDALAVLSRLPQDDARVQYLTAISRYKNQNPTLIQLDKSPYESRFISTIGAPMLKAFELDEENVKYIEHDGYFNDAYRLLVLYFWKRMKDGLSEDEVAKEYDALVKMEQLRRTN